MNEFFPAAMECQQPEFCVASKSIQEGRTYRKFEYQGNAQMLTGHFCAFFIDQEGDEEYFTLSRMSSGFETLYMKTNRWIETSKANGPGRYEDDFYNPIDFD